VQFNDHRERLVIVRWWRLLETVTSMMWQTLKIDLAVILRVISNWKRQLDWPSLTCPT